MGACMDEKQLSGSDCMWRKNSERYRDLLQASTSIILMAKSSKRVTEALEETHTIISSQEDIPSPRRGSSGHNGVSTAC